MTGFENPTPAGEYVTAEGHLRLRNGDIIDLLEMAQEAGSHAVASFTYASESAYRSQDQVLSEAIYRLKEATVGNGIVHLGRYWEDADANVWAIPLLDSTGQELTDEFYIHKFNLKDMTMLCSGLGPEVEDAEGRESFSHHVVFKASYVVPEQMIPVLWNTGEEGTHPDIPALEAEFMGNSPTEDKPVWIEDEIRGFWYAHSQKIQEFKEQKPQS